MNATVHQRVMLFLSTLSLRRATRVLDGSKSSIEISIHALLAESDVRQVDRISKTRRISIHALLAESDLIRMLNSPHSQISIHALLAESDSLWSAY